MKPVNKISVVVLGAGFAGIHVAEKLPESIFEVTLVDRLNHHQFQPLLYQVAASQIEPSSISFPLRNIFRRKRALRFLMAEVLDVDTTIKIINTSEGKISYDVLIIATGCKPNFFGNSQIEKYALTLKSTTEAIQIRNHVLNVFEKIASHHGDVDSSMWNLVIVGAGPTGVELAGAFSEIRKSVLPKDYPGVDFSKFKIILIEGGTSPLAAMSAKSGRDSMKYLQEMDIEFLPQTIVKDYDGKHVQLNDGTGIEAATFIWTAGVTGSLPQGISRDLLARGNRIVVNRYNQVMGLTDVYAVGDICLMKTPWYPDGHPQLANVAINQAKNLVKNLLAQQQNQPLKEYEYRDLGTMATIGRNKAVVDLGSIHLKGYPAWLIWMFLHLMLILSVKNKLIIFINWAWSYVTYDSSLRLILSPKQTDRK